MTRRQAARRPTVHDVARVAGVSHATVSRHLNGRANVAPATASAIDAAVRAVGYVPNPTARSLVQRRTGSIALVVREHADLFYADPTLSRMAAGANLALAELGYLQLLVLVDAPETEARVIEMIRGGSVDGALLVAMTTHDPVVEALRGAAVPIVTASAPLDEEDLAWVDTDNREATRLITQMLVATGRRRVAEVRGPSAMPVSALRHLGFRDALGDDYDPELVASADHWSFESGAAAAEKLLAAGRPFDGLVAASDLLAAGAMSVLAARGLRVPEDVGVVGFDDSPVAMMTTPPLTTVRQDAGETGREMAAMLVRLIDGAAVSATHVTRAAEIVWRESAGPRPSGVPGAV